MLARLISPGEILSGIVFGANCIGFGPNQRPQASCFTGGTPNGGCQSGYIPDAGGICRLGGSLT